MILYQVTWKYFFVETLVLEKKLQMTQKHEKLPSTQQVKELFDQDCMYFVCTCFPCPVIWGPNFK